MKRRKLLDPAALRARVTRHLHEQELMFVLRKGSPLGPVFVVSERTATVVAKNVPSIGALAESYGLVSAEERAA
ncbi:MAG: hypothetical protein ABI702_19650 [Burkholderiales bacterium]